MIIIVQVKARAKGLREIESRGIPFGQTVTFMLINLPLGAHTHTGRMIYMLRTVVVFMKTNKYADAVIKAHNVAH